MNKHIEKMRDCYAGPEIPMTKGELAAAADDFERHVSKLEHCRKALERIASQYTTTECDAIDLDPDEADWEGGFDAIVEIAREALNEQG